MDKRLSLQAEYALIENDSLQADIIFRYLISNSQDFELKKICAMRLFSLGNKDETGAYHLESNRDYPLLGQLISRQRLWVKRRNEIKQNIESSTFLDDDTIRRELIVINQSIQSSRINCTSKVNTELDFLQILVSESTKFYVESIRPELAASANKELAVGLICFLQKETLKRLFWLEFMPADGSGNSYYFDYMRYVNLIELQLIKLAYYSGQVNLCVDSEYGLATSKSYGIILFLQRQIFKNGLFNAKRKNFIRKKYNVQEQAILFYNNQYSLTKDKYWMDKILVAMDNIKSSILETKTKYYGSKGLLSELSRNLIYNIEKTESSPDLKSDSKKVKYEYIIGQMKLSDFYHCFYKVNEHFNGQAADVSLRKIKDICEKTHFRSSVVNVFDSKNFLFILRIGYENEALNIINKKNSVSLLASMEHVRQGCTNSLEVLNADKKSIQRFQKASHEIYKELLEPLFENDIPKELVIVPDGILNYIPFEALMVDRSSEMKNKVPYLIGYSSIRYYASLKMYARYEHLDNNVYSVNKISAYNPSYADVKLEKRSDYGLPDLPGAEEEIKMIDKLFDLESTGNKEKIFSSTRSVNNLLHLAMHSSSSLKHRNEPGMIFSNSRNDVTHLHDLSRLNNVPNAMVLSACETGQGKYVTGEGIRSIGHQFLQAGSESTIQSLNKVADRSGYKLISYFYQALKDKRTSQRALQYSKLKFITESDSFHAHPYFWTGSVSYGRDFIIDFN